MGSEVLRIDLLCLLTGCRKKATKPGCLYLFLNIVFFFIVLLFIEATFCVLLVMLVCVLSSLFWFRCK